MEKILFLCLIIFSFSCFGEERSNDHKILSLLNGMYEVVSWFDGKTLHEPPTVSGRWVFYDGKIISSIHNRTNENKNKSSFKWGHGSVVDGMFRYTYTETLNVKGIDKFAKMNRNLPWSGMRTFKVTLRNNEIEMTSLNGKQTWKITKDGMVYTDPEWSDDKIFVERRWKRITPLTKN